MNNSDEEAIHGWGRQSGKLKKGQKEKFILFGGDFVTQIIVPSCL